MLKKLIRHFKRELQLTREYYSSLPEPTLANDQSTAADQADLSVFSVPASKEKLSFAEKERILVQRITTKDMLQFDKLPYYLNRPVHKYIAEHAHAFAYININGGNIAIARDSLTEMNRRIEADCRISPRIPRKIQIPVSEIVFTPAKDRGYTRLICEPYTFEGKLSQFPLTLLFMTDLNSPKDTTHGSLHYDKEGNVAKAEIYFWRRNEGFFFYYETLDQSFRLSKVEYSNPSKTSPLPTTIYRDEYWVRLEAMREKERVDFEWLQTHIPSKCPKSVTGYRRMKHANTKNYQSLVASAKEFGRDIR